MISVELPQWLDEVGKFVAEKSSQLSRPDEAQKDIRDNKKFQGDRVLYLTISNGETEIIKNKLKDLRAKRLHLIQQNDAAKSSAAERILSTSAQEYGEEIALTQTQID